MNKEIEMLYSKIDAQDKIINELVLEIARLKEKLENTKPSWLMEETSDERIKRLEKAKEMLLKDRKEAIDLFVSYKQRIDKAIGSIKDIRQKTFTKYNSNEWNNCLSFNDDIKPLLEILEEKKTPEKFKVHSLGDKDKNGNFVSSPFPTNEEFMNKINDIIDYLDYLKSKGDKENE